jgi:outer membrane protein TolC
MLTGCTVGPDFHSPDPPGVTTYLPNDRATVSAVGDGVPGQRMSYGGDIPDRWWELLRSRHLNSLIEQGIIRNAELEAEAAGCAGH